jgi:hypothetical protein
MQEGHECNLSHPLTEEEFAGLTAKTEIIIFKGYILYQDVFGKAWKKPFGLYGNGDGKFYSDARFDAYNVEEETKPGSAPPK